jgi:hypothetical protein
VHLLTAGYEKQTPALLEMAGVSRPAATAGATAGAAAASDGD